MSDDYKLCPVCLSRIRHNIPKIRENEKCSICDNTLIHEDKIISLIEKKIHMLDVEFNTFLVALQINYDELKINEDNIHKLVNYKGHNKFKRILKRDITQKLSEKLNKTIDYKNPEIIIQIKIRKKAFPQNPFKDIKNIKIYIETNPLYIEGKYRKLERGIPQTKWPCSKCKTKGCPACNYTGQQYKYSVETLISKHLLKLTKGKTTKFHGSGREDIDVLMLGEGRPFVIEVKNPIKRNIDLKFLRRIVNSHSDGKIEINDLKYTDHNRKASIKRSSTESYKVYQAIAEFENGLTSKDIYNIETIKTIQQRTPQRVSHRRADLIRTRKIQYIDVERINSKKLKLKIKCQGGLYIKELISGDEGRTQPSISSKTQINAKCTQLDVIEVHIPEE